MTDQRRILGLKQAVLYLVLLFAIVLFKTAGPDMLIWPESAPRLVRLAAEKKSPENDTVPFKMDKSDMLIWSEAAPQHSRLSEKATSLENSKNETTSVSKAHRHHSNPKSNGAGMEPVIERLGSHNNNNNKNGTRLSPSPLNGITSAADLAMHEKLQLKKLLKRKEGNNRALPFPNNSVRASHSQLNYNSNNITEGMEPNMERLGSYNNKIGTRFSSFTTSGEFPDSYPTLSDRQRQKLEMNQRNITLLTRQRQKMNMNQGNTTLLTRQRQKMNMNQGNSALTTAKEEGIRHRRPGAVNTTAWLRHWRKQNITQGNNTLPNFFLAGTAKAGTTAIAAHIASLSYSCLGQDNANTSDYKNYVNGTNIKETHFFDRTKQWNMGPQYFLDLYRHCPNETTTTTTTSTNNNNNTHPLVMEATPANLAYADRIYELYKHYGNVQKLKIVISLREPVSREISNYAHMVRDLTLGRPNFPNWIRVVKWRLRNPDNTTKSFAEWSQFIWREVKFGVSLSLYATHLKRWFELFDRQQILLIWYDDFKENNARELARIHEFLGVPLPPTQRGAPHVNDRKVPMDVISCTDQGKLHNLFHKHDEELFALIASNPGPPMEHKRVPGYEYNCSETP